MITCIILKDDLGPGVMQLKDFVKHPCYTRFRARVVGTFFAKDWRTAMQYWYDYMGFGKYTPMED